jgi:small subunit ribosomal protein S18
MAQENNNQSEIRYLNPVSVDVKKKKYCRFKKLGIKYVDYKDGEFLKKFLNEQGKILPRRLTGTSQKFQKKVAQAVKRARHLDPALRNRLYEIIKRRREHGSNSYQGYRESGLRQRHRERKTRLRK